PASIRFVALAVFAIYFTLPAIALSALPVTFVNGEYQTLLGLPPEEGGFANDPVLGLVENLGISGTALDVLKVYVGILAATILFIATNAGVIGASRITYAMSHYRQLPEVFRRLHPRFKTPWLSLVALRYRRRDEELVYRARPNLRVRGVDWPLFAIFGGIATALAWLTVVIQTPLTRYAGLGWLVLGFIVYFFYRRRVVRAPLLETVRAPALILGPSLELHFRTILVPVVRNGESEEALVAAARLASERRATIAIVHVLEVPMSLPIDAELPEEEKRAFELLEEARALVDAYGVRTVTRLR